MSCVMLNGEVEYSKRRLLPESAYDFFARDGRDGEVGPRRDTIAEAKLDVATMRKPMASYNRCSIEVWWQVNERKVLRLIKGLR